MIAMLLLGCSGKGDQVAMWVATGAVLTAVHAIQKERRHNHGETEQPCTMFCGPGEVPCGDTCFPSGTLCYDAPAGACYGGDPTAEGVEMHTPNGSTNDGRTVYIPLINPLHSR